MLLGLKKKFEYRQFHVIRANMFISFGMWQYLFNQIAIVIKLGNF